MENRPEAATPWRTHGEHTGKRRTIPPRGKSHVRHGIQWIRPRNGFRQGRKSRCARALRMRGNYRWQIFIGEPDHAPDHAGEPRWTVARGRTDPTRRGAESTRGSLVTAHSGMEKEPGIHAENGAISKGQRCGKDFLRDSSRSPPRSRRTSPGARQRSALAPHPAIGQPTPSRPIGHLLPVDDVSCVAFCPLFAPLESFAHFTPFAPFPLFARVPAPGRTSARARPPHCAAPVP